MVYIFRNNSLPQQIWIICTLFLKYLYLSLCSESVNWNFVLPDLLQWEKWTLQYLRMLARELTCRVNGWVVSTGDSSSHHTSTPHTPGASVVILQLQATSAWWGPSPLTPQPPPLTAPTDAHKERAPRQNYTRRENPLERTGWGKRKKESVHSPLFISPACHSTNAPDCSVATL